MSNNQKQLEAALQGHTPGPWRGREFAGNIDLIGGEFPHQITVATVYNLGEMDGANARLIAAAPEMLEALQLIARSEGFNGGTWAGELQSIARAAIAKAGG